MKKAVLAFVVGIVLQKNYDVYGKASGLLMKAKDRLKVDLDLDLDEIRINDDKDK